MTTLDQVSKSAYIAYTGNASPQYGHNDPASVWATMSPANKAVWERVAIAVVNTAKD